MILEFVGISGVGKSTIAKDMYEEMSNKGLQVAWPRYHLYMQHKWLSRNFLKAIGCFFEIMFSPWWTIKVMKIFTHLKIKAKDKGVLLFNYLSYKKMFSKCTQTSCIYIFDEGVFQMIWATYLRSSLNVSQEIVEEIIELFQSPDKLVIVDADTPTIAKRLEKRATRTKIRESSNIENAIDIMRQKQEAIINAAISSGVLKTKTIERYNNNETQSKIQAKVKKEA